MFDSNLRNLSTTGMNDLCHYHHAYELNGLRDYANRYGSSRLVSMRLGYIGRKPVALVEGMAPETKGEAGTSIPTAHIPGFRMLPSFQLEGSEITVSGVATSKDHPLFADTLTVLGELAQKDQTGTIQFSPLPASKNNPYVSWKATFSNGTVTAIRKIRDASSKAVKSARQIGSATILVVGRKLALANNRNDAIAGGQNLPVIWEAKAGQKIATPLPRVTANGMLCVTTYGKDGKNELHTLDVSHLAKKGAQAAAKVSASRTISLPDGQRFVCDFRGERNVSVFAQLESGSAEGYFNPRSPVNIQFQQTPWVS